MKKNTFYTKALALAAVCVLAVGMSVQAQIQNPVKWSFSAKAISATEAEVTFKASIDEGWHIYSSYMEEGGPVPTSFNYDESKNYTLEGKIKESPEPHKEYSDIFSMDVLSFKKEAVFTQKVKLKNGATTIAGYLEFMACTDQECLMPEEVDFSIPVTPKK